MGRVALYLACVAGAAACVSPETEAECRAAVAAERACRRAAAVLILSAKDRRPRVQTCEHQTYEGCGYWSTSGDPSGEPGGTACGCARRPSATRTSTARPARSARVTPARASARTRTRSVRRARASGSRASSPARSPASATSGAAASRVDGSNSQASQACAGDRVWLDCGTACEKVCGEKSDDVCTEQCVPACQCPKYTVLESADGDVCLRMKECRKRRKSDDDMTFWGFDDDGEDWYADSAKKKADDDDEARNGFVVQLSRSLGRLADRQCWFDGRMCVHRRHSHRRRGDALPAIIRGDHPTVELGQVIVAEEVLGPRSDANRPPGAISLRRRLDADP